LSVFRLFSMCKGAPQEPERFHMHHIGVMLAFGQKRMWMWPDNQTPCY
jgi:hypothetical protein